MLLSLEDKVHVVERRLFDADIRRHFVGTIVRLTEVAALVRGTAFVYDAGRAAFVRIDEERTRVVSLVDARLLVRLLPPEADLAAVTYEMLGDRLVVTDGVSFTLDINEFGARR